MKEQIFYVKLLGSCAHTKVIPIIPAKHSRSDTVVVKDVSGGAPTGLPRGGSALRVAISMVATWKFCQPLPLLCGGNSVGISHGISIFLN